MAAQRLPKTVELDPASGGYARVAYGNVYEAQERDGRRRLFVGADDEHVDLVIALTAHWTGVCYLAYALIVPRGEAEPGRYEAPAISRDGIVTFLERSRRLLSEDARHEVWLSCPATRQMLVWDRHDRIWIYNDVEQPTAVLGARGFRPGAQRQLRAHQHHYHPEFDADARALHASMAWTRSPLQPGDGE
jgi:hypothetical protein